MLDMQPDDQPVPPARTRLRKLLFVAGILTGVLLLVCGGGAIALRMYVGSVEGDVDRVDAFQGVPEQARPSKAPTNALNILVLGSDSRADRDLDNDGSARTDTIILVHIPADRQTAQLISIPRDSWVHIPGKKFHKINAAYAFGGTPLMVQTVESFTNVRIDHVVLIDFFGFKEVIDALGGVDIEVEREFKSSHPPFRVFRKGMQHMNGEVALDYSRQRKQFADGDFSRIEHQQQVIKAVMEQAASAGLLSDIPRLNSFLRATANALTVDQNMSLFDLALELRQLRSHQLKFITSPSRGTGMEGNQSVVYVDEPKARELYAAVNADRVP
ncbi:LCP family protein [Allorhizocola rhizosphaerae]|uniref:LCP family protein n=1 Tax=Allorhizocola rhizosphaerae TaxID=1872709 RepID=UPI000E3C02D3|nr:LCP family protein [Allorhizocola rhizosphaerae]